MGADENQRNFCDSAARRPTGCHAKEMAKNQRSLYLLIRPRIRIGAPFSRKKDKKSVTIALPFR
jgi:hypothetical protein